MLACLQHICIQEDASLLLWTAGDLILEVANRAPVKDDFQFASIAEGLSGRGKYVLQYEVQPQLPGLPALTSCTRVQVAAGQPISLEIQVQPQSSWNHGNCGGAQVAMQLYACVGMHDKLVIPTA